MLYSKVFNQNVIGNHDNMYGLEYLWAHPINQGGLSI